MLKTYIAITYIIAAFFVTHVLIEKEDVKTDYLALHLVTAPVSVPYIVGHHIFTENEE